MIENIKEFWYLYLFLIALIAIVPFAFKAAIGAATRHSKEFNGNMEKLKHAKEMRDAYSSLTPEIIAGAPADALFEGVAVCLESRCQKTEDTNAFYTSLTTAQQRVYALYYLLSDAKEASLSKFFKNSSRPLTTDALAAAQELFSSELSSVIKRMFDCYDDENEEESVIPEVVEKLDSEYADLTQNENLFTVVGNYIKENPSLFIEKH